MLTYFSTFLGEIDYSSVEQAITSITTNLPEMSQGVRVLAALTPSGDHLLDAARKLCSAFTDLLKAVQPNSNTVCQIFNVVWNILVITVVHAIFLGASKFVECC